MPDYQKMYAILFNAITDSINTLVTAQKECEELYISSEEPQLFLLKKESPEETPPD